MMHVYTILFLVGLLGLVAQALLGYAGHGHAGHGQHHAGHGQHHHGDGQGPGARWGATLIGLLSPLTLFSLCLGVGATGLLMRHLPLSALARVPLSLLGGALFYSLVVRPLWGLVFRFASAPAGALEGTVAGAAEALTRFDAQGKGLVRLTIDGQLVRVLAFLEPDERAQAAAVRPGDALTVISVDGRANTCRVAKL